MIKVLISPINMKTKSFELEVNPSDSGKYLIDYVSLLCDEKNIKILFKGQSISLEKTIKNIGIIEGSNLIVMKIKVDGITQDRPAFVIPKQGIPETKTENKTPAAEEIKEDPIQKTKSSQRESENIKCIENTVSGLLTWGSNSSGKLGIDSIDFSAFPCIIKLPVIVPLSMVACGSYHTVAIDVDGNLFQWGRCLYPKENTSKYCNKTEPWRIESVKEFKFNKISAGSGHSLALDSRGNVWSWGEGVSGQLGHGVLDNEFYPRLVEDIQGFKFIEIAAGGSHSVSITSKGECIVWGKNQLGQLGTGDKADRTSPTIILDFTAHNAKCGIGHTAWKKNTHVYISGNSKTNPEIAFTDAKLFTCGGSCTYIINSNNELITLNEDGKFFNEKKMFVKDLASSGNVTFLLLEDGKLIGKGDNKQGQLGVGDCSSRPDWTAVKIYSSVKKISCSSTHVCALIENSNLSFDLEKVFDLDFKDTSIECSNGIFRAHFILLNSHTDPGMLFHHEYNCFKTPLSLQCAEVLVLWLYTGRINEQIDDEVLTTLQLFSSSKNLEVLSEQLKKIINERQCTKDYFALFPDYKVADTIAKMTQIALKKKIEASNHLRNNLERLPDHIDEEPDTDEQVDQDIDMQPPVTINPAEERRRKILEALERRINN
jgi:alpha-tubulin suppressor-like RCC1 family protein